MISSTEEDEYNEYWRKRTNVANEQKAQKLDINQRVLKYIEIETAKLIAAARAHGIKI